MSVHRSVCKPTWPLTNLGIASSKRLDSVVQAIVNGKTTRCPRISSAASPYAVQRDEAAKKEDEAVVETSHAAPF